MGNVWTGVDDDALLEAEARILLHSGILLDRFDRKYVEIDEGKNKIRTIIVGERDKPKLVIVHGYGGSGLVFYKLMKQLAEHYCCYYIDIIGMGASSRPPFECKTATEADDYFAQFIEKWRLAMDDMKDFFLAGHSFGGYICGQYALRYPQNIKKLLMLSPAGMVYMPEDWNFRQVQFKDGQGPSKVLRSFSEAVWENKWSPFGAMRASGRLVAGSFVNKYMNENFSHLPELEREDLIAYFKQIFMREGSSEYAIFVLFKLGMYAYNPLETENRMGSRNFQVPVSFFYGDEDWMDIRGGLRVVEKNIYYKTLSHVYEISDSDHHLYFDNPDEFAQQIIFDIQDTLDREDLITSIRNEYANNSIVNETINTSIGGERNFENTSENGENEETYDSNNNSIEIIS